MLAIRWVLSLIFIIQMYLAMVVFAVIYAPWALFSRAGARAAAHGYARWVILTARLLCGLKTEVRGTPPTAEVVIAAKHQSFFDIIVIYASVPRGRFIVSICTRPSTTTAAGEGLHPTVRPLDWWLERIARVGGASRPKAGSRYIVGRFKSDGGCCGA